MSGLNGSPWQKVVYAHDCSRCDLCSEPVCPICHDHYADCGCPGPHQEDEYYYETIKGVEYARIKDPEPQRREDD
jgi:hypothetical protein